jgi:hypothetical protein
MSTQPKELFGKRQVGGLQLYVNPAGKFITPPVWGIDTESSGKFR